jgi:hypothetical protein
MDASIPEVIEDTWTLAGDVAATLLADIANKEKDHADEALDACRTHNGMTLDEYLSR